MLAGSLRAAAGWSEAGGAVHELTQQAGVAVMAAYSSIIGTQTQRRDISLPRSVTKVPSSKWPAIASRESSYSIISEA